MLEVEESFAAVANAAKHTKSPEDMNRLKLDEKLDEVERTAFCLASSHPLQQQYALKSLPRLLANPALKHRALALMTESSMNFLTNAKADLQVEAGQSILLILDANCLNPIEIEEHILPVVVLFLNRIAALDTNLRALWQQAFIDMSRLLAVNKLRGWVLEFVMAKAQYEQPTPNRALAASSIAVLCELLDAATIEQDLFVQAMSLCQDTEYEVRAMMCEQLATISRAVSADLVNGRMLDELLDLVSDEILMVRRKAFEALIHMCDVFESSTRSTHILPMLKQICRQMPDDMRQTIAANFGMLSLKVSTDLMADGESLLFYETFKGLCANSDEICRKHCAYNMPAVVKSLGAPKFAVHLLDSLTAMSVDSSVGVRETVAAGLHAVATLLGKQRTSTHLRSIVTTLLRDSSLEVCAALTKHLRTLLNLFCLDGDADGQEVWTEFVEPLLTLESTLRPKWRVHLQLLEQWHGLPDWFSQKNEIYEHFVPVLFLAMQQAPSVVAEEAAQVLCICVHRNKFDFQQRALCQRTLRDFARATTWSSRLLFLSFCEMVLQLFSRRFFRTHFLDDVLMMDCDAVPNIRHKLCQMLPGVNGTLPVGSVHSKRLTGLLHTLSQDTDREVAAAAKLAVAAIAEANASSEAQARADEIDHRRELEEDTNSKAEAALHQMMHEQRNSSRSRQQQLQNLGLGLEHRPGRDSARRPQPAGRRKSTRVADGLLDPTDFPTSSGTQKGTLKGRRAATMSAPSLHSLASQAEAGGPSPLVSYKPPKQPASSKQLPRPRRHSSGMSNGLPVSGRRNSSAESQKRISCDSDMRPKRTASFSASTRGSKKL